MLPLLLSALMLAGCATGKPYAELTKSLRKPPYGMARIIFYRTSPLGLAVQPDIELDGKAVGKSVPSGFFICNVRPGKHNIYAKTEVDSQLDITVHPGTDRLCQIQNWRRAVHWPHLLRPYKPVTGKI